MPQQVGLLGDFSWWSSWILQLNSFIFLSFCFCQLYLPINNSLPFWGAFKDESKLFSFSSPLLFHPPNQSNQFLVVFTIFLFPTFSFRYLLIMQCKTVAEPVLLAVDTAEQHIQPAAEVSNKHILLWIRFLNFEWGVFVVQQAETASTILTQNLCFPTGSNQWEQRAPSGL